MPSRKKPRRYRGPSRPIDPRYAPGQQARRGLDTFGLVLVGASTAVVVLIILYIAVTQGVTTGTTAGATDPNSSGASATALAQQQLTAYQTQIATVPRISAQEAKTLHASGTAKFIDVRPADQYAAGHITGATNVPYNDNARLAAEVPKEGDVILYCQ